MVRCENVARLFPFGFGLSYTRFELTDFKAEKIGSDEVSFSLRVQQRSTRRSGGGASLRGSLGSGRTPRPRELKEYGKASLEPGETKIVTLKMNTADLMFWDMLPSGGCCLPVTTFSKQAIARAICR